MEKYSHSIFWIFVCSSSIDDTNSQDKTDRHLRRPLCSITYFVRETQAIDQAISFLQSMSWNYVPGHLSVRPSIRSWHCSFVPLWKNRGDNIKSCKEKPYEIVLPRNLSAFFRIKSTSNSSAFMSRSFTQVFSSFAYPNHLTKYSAWRILNLN